MPEGKRRPERPYGSSRTSTASSSQSTGCLSACGDPVREVYPFIIVMEPVAASEVRGKLWHGGVRHLSSSMLLSAVTRQQPLLLPSAARRSFLSQVKTELARRSAQGPKHVPRRQSCAVTVLGREEPRHYIKGTGTVPTAAMRTHTPPPVLHLEDVTVEIGGPLTTFDRERQITQRIAHIGLYLAPEELRIWLAMSAGVA